MSMGWATRVLTLRPFGAFDEPTAFEAGTRPDEGDEVGCVHGSPSLLGGFEELDAHGQGGGAGAGLVGDLGSQADRGEGGLNRVGGPQVDQENRLRSPVA